MKDGVLGIEICLHCCGTCICYSGHVGDGYQICDIEENIVRDDKVACDKWQPKYN